MLKRIFGLFLSINIFLIATAFAQTQNVWIDGDHGKLSAIVQTPDNQKKFPLVILCHGFNAQKNYPLIEILADDLEKIGIASIRFDFNGHGESQGDFQDMTVLNEIEDAKKVYDYAKNISGVTNISIAGHSQGGVVASMLAGELGANKIKSVALMAPASMFRDDLLRGNLYGNKFDAQNPPEILEMDTHGYGILKIGRNYITTSQTLPIFETSKKFTGSVLIVHGTFDTIAPYTCGLHFHEIYKNSELKLLNGFDHSFSQDTEKVSKIIVDFFAKKLK